MAHAARYGVYIQPKTTVIPAEAGIQGRYKSWIPACAGLTSY